MNDQVSLLAVIGELLVQLKVTAAQLEAANQKLAAIEAKKRKPKAPPP